MGDWFSNYRVSAKFVALFGMVISASVALGAYFLVNLERVSTQATALAATRVSGAKHLGGVTTHIARFRNAEGLHVLSHDEAEKRLYDEEARREAEQTKAELVAYRDLVSPSAEDVMFERIYADFDDLLRIHTQVSKLSLASNEREAIALLKGDGFRATSLFLQRVGELSTGNDVATSNAALDATRAYRDARLASLIALAALGILVVVAARFGARQIVGSIGVVSAQLAELASGEADLSKRLDARAQDELGELAANFNKLLAQLEAIVSQAKGAGEQVTAASSQLASSATALESSVSEQVSSMTEVVTTTTKISITSQSLLDTMNHVSQTASLTAASAGRGQAGLERTSNSVNILKEAAAAISSRLGAINEQASNISSVVTTITKVADQTNLLSLNAAIEAEKAGEFGQGFSVVAREIRRLADQTAVATLDIEKTVKDMRSAVSSGVSSVEKFSSEVRDVASIVRDTVLQFGEILDQVRALTPKFDVVAEGMRGQSERAKQISVAMEQLRETSQRTQSAIRDSAYAVEVLNESASALERAFSRFS
jgi:methyl-accepting chemotaxis protein WspA